MTIENKNRENGERLPYGQKRSLDVLSRVSLGIISAFLGLTAILQLCIDQRCKQYLSLEIDMCLVECNWLLSRGWISFAPICKLISALLIYYIPMVLKFSFGLVVTITDSLVNNKFNKISDMVHFIFVVCVMIFTFEIFSPLFHFLS